MNTIPENHQPHPPMPAWINTRSRICWCDQYALNEQETAFRAYDPERITEELVATGADNIAIFAVNQYGIAYYPSAILPQHPNLRGRDYVGDLTARFRARGKKVILYINWLDSKHPEWNTVRLGQKASPDTDTEYPLASWADPDRPNGRVLALPGGQWQLPCLNSPKRGQVVALAEEILQRYQPDAFHLDMFFDTEICVCQYCRPTLEQICGTSDLTDEVIRRHWRKYIDWRCARSAALLADLTEVLHTHGVIAAHNGFAPLFVPAAWGVGREWLPSLDVFVSECFEIFGAPGTDLNSTSINVRWQHAIGKPSWMLRHFSPIHYAHWTITAAQWQLYAAACKANGGKVFGPCGVGAHPDTTRTQASLDAITDGLAFYMQDADLDVDAESAADIALVFSWATRKYDQADASGMQWSEELNGWARLMIEEHLPWDFVVAEYITTPEVLAKYDLVVLPNIANLSDRCCEMIRAYVRGGGHVLATAETSLSDERGEARTDFALGDVFGISRQSEADGHFAIAGHREPEPASGRFQRVATTGETLARLVAVDPAGSVAGMKDPMPLGLTPWPVFVRHSFGAGQSLYAAFAIGRYYTLHGDAHIGTWMADSLDTLLPARQLTVTAPRTVEVTLWRQPALPRTIIHLANRSVPWTLPTDARQVTEILPVHNVQVTMPTPYPNAQVSCRGAEVAVRHQGNQLVVEVSVLHAYAAIVIEPS